MEVWQTSNLRRLRLGEEKKERKKKERRRTNHSMKIYMVSLLHRATINEQFLMEIGMGFHYFISRHMVCGDYIVYCF